jgi:hypothetical protein
MRRKKRRRLPNGEEFPVDREERWARRPSVATAIACVLIERSLLSGLVSGLVGVCFDVEAMTLIWEEVGLFRANNPCADHRAESKLLREERLRKERQEEERRR